MIDALIHDLRHAARALFHSPSFAVAAILTLAIGIGANSVLFSVINAVLLRPLPYPHPEELVRLFEVLPHRDGHRFGSSPGEFLAWRERNQVFAHLAAYENLPANLTGGGAPEQVSTAHVSADYFPLLGLAAARGRVFLPEEDQPGRDDVAVLSYGLWQRRYGGDPGIVGKTILIDARPVTVLGVLPADVKLPDGSDLALPLAFTAADRDERGHHYLDVIARLRPQMGLDEARAGMSSLAAALWKDLPAGRGAHGLELAPLHEVLVGDARPALRVLLGAVGCVLLIACANVAGLLLSRAATREREIAIRMALGASRARLISHLMAEGLVVAIVGGASGLLLSMWGVDLLPRLIPGGLPSVDRIGLDWTVVCFTLLVSVVCGLTVGLLPALHSVRAMPGPAVHAGGRGLTESARRQRLRGILVGAEMALTLVLLVGASLLLRSFLRLRSVDPGFAADRRIVADLALPALKYPDPQRVNAFYDAMLERLATLPGVEAVGLVNVLPLSGSNVSGNYSIEGEIESEAAASQLPNANRRAVSSDYFQAFGMRLIEGRAFTPRDTATSPLVVIINETLAARRFPKGDAIGRRLRRGGGRLNTSPWLEIVGIVGDIRHEALDVAAREEMYQPYAQFASNDTGEMTIVISTRGDTSGLAAALRAQVQSIDPDQPLSGIRPMDELVGESLAPRRAAMWLLGAFAATAVLLAAVGLYGLISYSVTRRTQEIGVRMALGARARDVLMMILRQGLTLAGAGVGAGLVAALALTRLMTGLLYGIGAADPWTFGCVPMILAAIALLASVLPARRAARLDPMVALRSE